MTGRSGGRAHRRESTAETEADRHMAQRIAAPIEQVVGGRVYVDVKATGAVTIRCSTAQAEQLTKRLAGQ